MSEYLQFDPWECPFCTLVNSYENRYCDACNYRSRHVIVSKQSRKRKMSSDNLDSSSLQNTDSVSSSSKNVITNTNILKPLLASDSNDTSHKFQDSLEIPITPNSSISSNILQNISQDHQFQIESEPKDISDEKRKAVDWTCPECSCLNLKIDRKCICCGFNYRPIQRKVKSSIKPELVSVPQSLDPHQLTNTNGNKPALTSNSLQSQSNDEILQSCSLEPCPKLENPTAASDSNTWKCHKCTLENPKSFRYCDVCGAKDPNAIKLSNQNQPKSNLLPKSPNVSNKSKIPSEEIQKSSKLASPQPTTPSSSRTLKSEQSKPKQPPIEPTITDNSILHEVYDSPPPLKRGWAIIWPCSSCTYDNLLKDGRCVICNSLQNKSFRYIPLCTYHKALEKRMFKRNQENATLNTTLKTAPNTTQITTQNTTQITTQNSTQNITQNTPQKATQKASKNAQSKVKVVPRKAIPIDHMYRPPRIGNDFQVSKKSILPVSKNYVPLGGRETYFEPIWLTNPDITFSTPYEDKSKQEKPQNSMDHDHYQKLDESYLNPYDTYIHSYKNEEVSALKSLWHSQYCVSMARHEMDTLQATAFLSNIQSELKNVLSSSSNNSVKIPHSSSSSLISNLQISNQTSNAPPQIIPRPPSYYRSGALDMKLISMNTDERNDFIDALVKCGPENWHDIAKELRYKYRISEIQDYYYAYWLPKFPNEQNEIEKRHRTFKRVSAAILKRSKKSESMSKSESDPSFLSKGSVSLSEGEDDDGSRIAGESLEEEINGEIISEMIGLGK